MTGDDVNKDHDDLEFDDDEFILDDWDEAFDSTDDASEDIFDGTEDDADEFLLEESAAGGAQASTGDEQPQDEDCVTLDADDGAPFMPPAEDDSGDEAEFALDAEADESTAGSDAGEMAGLQLSEPAEDFADEDMFDGIAEEVDAQIEAAEAEGNPLQAMFDEAAAQGRNTEDRAIPEDQVGGSDRLEGAEEAELFSHEAVQSETLINPEGMKPPFDEEGAEPWAGESVELEDLGMDMDADAGDVEDDAEVALNDGLHDDDLELVEIEDELDSPSADGFQAEADQDDAAQEFDADAVEVSADSYTVTEDHGDFELTEETDPEWAPVDEDAAEDDEQEQGYEVDEDYGFEEEEEADFSEHEEYFEESAIAGDGRPRRSAFRWVAAMAAVLLVSSAAAIYKFKPEWLSGNHTEQQLIEVVKVNRPKPTVTVDKPGGLDPAQKDPTEKGPAQKDPRQKDPAQKDPAQKDPTQEDPTEKDPAQKDPAQKDPQQQNPAQNDPHEQDPSAAEAERQAFAMAAETPQELEENPLLGAREDPKQMVRQVVQPEAGLVMGSQALAQLHNDNIFVGRVKKMDASFVTLRMEVGEITLDRREVRVLTPLAKAEYQEWKGAAQSGYVRLRNNNRLKGKIVEARDDSVVLQLNANRVIIPKSAIEEIASEKGKPVHFSQEETLEKDEWVQRLLEEQRRKMAAKPAKGAIKVKIEQNAKPQK